MANVIKHDWIAFYEALNADAGASVRGVATKLGIPTGTALTRIRRDGWSRVGKREPVRQAPPKRKSPDAA